MRRANAAAMGFLMLTGTACGDRGLVGHGRQASWRQVEEPSFTAEASHTIEGLAGPGDGYPAWTAVGRVRMRDATTPVVWSAADGMRWERVPLPVGVDRQPAVNAVARRQGVAVAVGAATTPGGRRVPRAWTSRDGTSWSAVAPAAVGASGDQGMTSVAAGPMGFVAAGFDHSGDQGRPAVWWSEDGLDWTRVGAKAGGAFGAGEAINGVAVGPRGVVAVGTIDTDGDVDAMAWFSPDGLRWRSVPLGLAGFTGPAKQEAMAVTAIADGFVAVGADSNAERRVAVAWRSDDGVLWHRQPPSPDMGRLSVGDSTAGVAAVAVAGSGPLVALGGAGSLRVWTSPDGRRWTGEPPPAQVRDSEEGALVAAVAGAVLLRPGTGGLWFRPAGAAWVDVGGDKEVFPTPVRSSAIRAAVRVGGRFVALGSVRGGGTEEGPALWTSSDARTWTRSAPFATGSVEEVTAFGSDLVAAGTDRNAAGESVASTWVSTDDGSTWERVGAGNPAFRIRQTTQIFGVTAAGPGLVAVGLSYENGGIDAHAWTSADGRSWRRSVDPPAWSGVGDEVLGTACPLPGGGVVALGTVTVAGEQDAWAWVSSDGVNWERATGPGASSLAGAGLQFPADCAPTGTGVLVTGTMAGDGQSDGVLWFTADGRTWTASPFAGPADEGLYGIDVDGARVVLTGREGDDLTVFTSSDGGSTWDKRTALGFAGPGYQTGYPVIAGDEVMLAGRDGASAAVWVGPAPDATNR